MRYFFSLLFLQAYFPVLGQNNPGFFERAEDVGLVRIKGSTVYQPVAQRYVISGSGSNIWFAKDEFHFAWKKIKGDFILHTRAVFMNNKTADPHRKLGWMVRNSLETGSAMVAAAVHGDGLAALQSRPRQDDSTAEIRSGIAGPDVVQLERRGNRFIMSVARFGELLDSVVIDSVGLAEEVYAGLFVCSHNASVLEKAAFSNVRIVKPAGPGFVQYRQYLGSYLELLDVGSGERRIVYADSGSLQAPNWTTDNKALIYNHKGLIYRFDLKNQKTGLINTDFVKANNNDHVISFDGKMLGLSSSSAEPKYGSIIYTVPITGGKPWQITPIGPSYLHGWSPDGRFLTYTGQRNGEFDIYVIPSGGGEEVRLTSAPGLDDGSEYSPDGRYIYFNSVRTGRMQLWRMRPDGSSQEQLTFDSLNNWFPHISPDGKWIAFLTFGNDVSPSDHPFYKRVYLRLMPAAGGNPRVIAYLYGGQGTINTPSWSPDSRRLAFVSNSGMVQLGRWE